MHFLSNLFHNFVSLFSLIYSSSICHLLLGHVCLFCPNNIGFSVFNSHLFSFPGNNVSGIGIFLQSEFSLFDHKQVMNDFLFFIIYKLSIYKALIKLKTELLLFNGLVVKFLSTEIFATHHSIQCHLPFRLQHNEKISARIVSMHQLLLFSIIILPIPLYSILLVHFSNNY